MRSIHFLKSWVESQNMQANAGLRCFFSGSIIRKICYHSRIRQSGFPSHLLDSSQRVRLCRVLSLLHLVPKPWIL